MKVRVFYAFFDFLYHFQQHRRHLRTIAHWQRATAGKWGKTMEYIQYLELCICFGNGDHAFWNLTVNDIRNTGCPRILLGLTRYHKPPETQYLHHYEQV
ncbi:hypothetical protein NPIL_45671 [Nephila pilipes]|uniref:Uncharacterized protein n=1 Tax=Nephila pilipes TaxID=299642 RepID=A0A8X6R0P6_NEPPI|nr:hypothetical protein NPIL_45671 [Nephila pilipes]